MLYKCIYNLLFILLVITTNIPTLIFWNKIVGIYTIFLSTKPNKFCSLKNPNKSLYILHYSSNECASGHIECVIIEINFKLWLLIFNWFISTKLFHDDLTFTINSRSIVTILKLKIVKAIKITFISTYTLFLSSLLSMIHFKDLMLMFYIWLLNTTIYE